MPKPKAAFVIDSNARTMVYGPEELSRIAGLVTLVGPPQTRDTIAASGPLLKNVEILLSGWGCPVLSEQLLDSLPRLKAVFYAAGAMGAVLTPEVWNRGIVVSSAISANSIPVAEYTLATILFSLKHGWRLARETREQKTFVNRDTAPGCFGTTVGLISLGHIARTLLRLLRPFDLKVIVHDPFVTPAEACALGVELATLPELFTRSDVVSLHSPHLPETEGLITGQLLASMKLGATFINTARAAIVRQDELIDVAIRRPELQFILDVADPEPPLPSCPLYTLPNVVLTPHMAGSVGTECRRMGQYMIEELERYLSGQPLKWKVTPSDAIYSSHRPIGLKPRPERAVDVSVFTPPAAPVAPPLTGTLARNFLQ